MTKEKAMARFNETVDNIARLDEAYRAVREGLVTALTAGLEGLGWQRFEFYSAYYGSHEELGEGDESETYYFRPTVDVDRWRGERFEHGHFEPDPASAYGQFHAWLEGLVEGEDYVSIP